MYEIHFDGTEYSPLLDKFVQMYNEFDSQSLQVNCVGSIFERD